MLEEIDSLEKIHKEGRMDKRLKYTLLWLFLLGTMFFGLGLYDLFVRNFSLLAVGFIFIGAFLAGYHIFWRSMPIEWDTKKAIARTGTLDITALIIFLIYVVLRIVLKDVLSIYYHDAIKASGLTSFAIAGVIFGRLFATTTFLHKRENKIK